MKYFDDISKINHIDDAIVTVGIFDGIHRGHNAIFSKMREIKNAKGGDIVVITFEPHPREVLVKSPEPVKYINSKGRKLDMFAKLDVDIVVDVHFDKNFAMLSTEDFLKQYIVKFFKPSYIVVGYDCHFGHDNEDTLSILKAFAPTFGYHVMQIPPVYFDNTIISSSKIRKALVEGDVDTANKMLGYEYNIYGQVVYGSQIGRTIGFPTVNLYIENNLKLIAAKGVYACKIKWHDNFYFGMCNIGNRPTVNGSNTTIEVNIFDFNREIYGENICVFLCKKMRNEVKFDNLLLLKEQLEKDKIAIREYFHLKDVVN